MAVLVKPNTFVNGIISDAPSTNANWDVLYNFINANLTAVNGNLGVWAFTANADATVPLSLVANSATQTAPLLRAQSLTTGATQPSGLVAMQWSDGAAAAHDVTLQADATGHLVLAGATGVSNSQVLQINSAGRIITAAAIPPIAYFGQQFSAQTSVPASGYAVSSVPLSYPVTATATGWLITAEFSVQGFSTLASCVIGLGGVAAIGTTKETDYSVMSGSAVTASSHNTNLATAFGGTCYSDTTCIPGANIKSSVRYRTLMPQAANAALTIYGGIFNNGGSAVFVNFNVSVFAQPY